MVFLDCGDCIASFTPRLDICFVDRLNVGNTQIIRDCGVFFVAMFVEKFGDGF